MSSRRGDSGRFLGEEKDLEQEQGVLVELCTLQLFINLFKLNYKLSLLLCVCVFVCFYRISVALYIKSFIFLYVKTSVCFGFGGGDA